MSDLGAKILSLAPKQVSRIAYGVMASATTVSIEGAVTAVPVPQLASAGVLVSGDYVAVQMVGADSLIVGKVGAPTYPTRLAYETMASATTVSIDGGTAATVPQLASAGVLEAGDDVAIQVVGADSLIIGKVGTGNPWQTYVPAMTNVTIGNGNIYGEYCVIAGTVFFRASYTYGTTDTGSGTIGIGLPDDYVGMTPTVFGLVYYRSGDRRPLSGVGAGGDRVDMITEAANYLTLAELTNSGSSYTALRFQGFYPLALP
jgi:hypothetical protein